MTQMLHEWSFITIPPILCRTEMCHSAMWIWATQPRFTRWGDLSRMWLMMNKKRMKMKTNMTFIRTQLGGMVRRIKEKTMRQDHQTPSIQRPMTSSCTLRLSWPLGTRWIFQARWGRQSADLMVHYKTQTWWSRISTRKWRNIDYSF